MKLISGTLILLTGAAGMLAVISPNNQSLNVVFGLCLGVWLLIAVFKVFGNH